MGALPGGRDPQRRPARATRFAGSLTDITKAKLADGLTGLPNRVLFRRSPRPRDQPHRRRRSDYQFALVILGLDRFKTVNHSLGLPTADRLLVEVAHRLQACLRATDAVTHGGHGFTLARLGGDEFTVLLDDIDDASDAVRVAERLREALQRPFEVERPGRVRHGERRHHRQQFRVHGSGRRAAEMPRLRCTARRPEAQRSCELFDVGMRDRAVSRLRVETDMRQAIERGAFEVYYQPIVAVRGGTLAGFEALVRWRHPTQGLIDPADFIPIAEDTEMIVLIGRQVLAESCRQMAAWQRRFGAAAPRRHVRQRVEQTVRRRRSHGSGRERCSPSRDCHPSSLKLEITESAFLGDIRARAGDAAASTQ